LVDEQRYQEAIIEFRRAHELQPHPRALYNIGTAWIMLGRPVEAVEALSRYVDEANPEANPERHRKVIEELERQRGRIAELRFDIEPAGATIEIDGRKVGVAPLSETVSVAVGKHRIGVTLGGFEPYDEPIAVAGRDVRELRIRLEAEGTEPRVVSAGQVSIDCPIPGVSVIVDDEVVAATPLTTPVVVPAGDHVLAFRRPGYDFESARVRMSGRSLRKARCQLASTPGTDGGAITVRAPGAAVTVDGISVDGTIRLPEGPHVVRASKAGFEPWQRSVNLRVGDNKVLVPSFAPTAATVREVDAAVARRRVAGWSLIVGGTAVGVMSAGHFLWNADRRDDWEREQDRIDAGWLGTCACDDYIRELEQRQARNDGLRDSIDRARPVSYGLLAGSVVLLSAGTYFLTFGASPKSYETTISQRPHGFAWQGRWAW